MTDPLASAKALKLAGSNGNGHEEVARYRARHLTEAQAEATWSAVWQLRLDVIAALERCEAGERAARWVRDE